MDQPIVLDRLTATERALAQKSRITPASKAHEWTAELTTASEQMVRTTATERALAQTSRITPASNAREWAARTPASEQMVRTTAMERAPAWTAGLTTASEQTARLIGPERTADNDCLARYAQESSGPLLASQR